MCWIAILRVGPDVRGVFDSADLHGNRLVLLSVRGHGLVKKNDEEGASWQFIT